MEVAPHANYVKRFRIILIEFNLIRQIDILRVAKRGV